MQVKQTLMSPPKLLFCMLFSSQKWAAESNILKQIPGGGGIVVNSDVRGKLNEGIIGFWSVIKYLFGVLQ